MMACATPAMRCKCGSQLFLETTMVRGPWVSLIDSADPLNPIDTNLDHLRHGKRPKTVSCAECGRRNPNPAISPDGVLPSSNDQKGGA